MSHLITEGLIELCSERTFRGYRCPYKGFGCPSFQSDNMIVVGFLSRPAKTRHGSATPHVECGLSSIDLC